MGRRFGELGPTNSINNSEWNWGYFTKSPRNPTSKSSGMAYAIIKVCQRSSQVLCKLKKIEIKFSGGKVSPFLGATRKKKLHSKLFDRDDFLASAAKTVLLNRAPFSQ